MAGEAGGERDGAQGIGGTAGRSRCRHGAVLWWGASYNPYPVRRNVGDRMTDQPIRLGIIGAGIMGERMLRAARSTRPTWCRCPASGTPRRPRSTGSHAMPAARAAAAAAVIAGADCVYVATPPGTHLDYAAQALAAGRAVFLEKPLATDTAASDAFVRRHETARAAVNFPFASSFAVERLRAWLRRGRHRRRHARSRSRSPSPAGPARGSRRPPAGSTPRPRAASRGRSCPTSCSWPAACSARCTCNPPRVERTPGGTERRVEARLTAGGLRTGLQGASARRSRTTTTPGPCTAPAHFGCATGPGPSGSARTAAGQPTRTPRPTSACGPWCCAGSWKASPHDPRRAAPPGHPVGSLRGAGGGRGDPGRPCRSGALRPAAAAAARAGLPLRLRAARDRGAVRADRRAGRQPHPVPPPADAALARPPSAT